MARFGVVGHKCDKAMRDKMIGKPIGYGGDPFKCNNECETCHCAIELRVGGKATHYRVMDREVEDYE